MLMEMIPEIDPEIEDFAHFPWLNPDGTKVELYGHKELNFSLIDGMTHFGENVTISQWVFIGEQVRVGNSCRIGRGVSISNKVVICNDVIIGRQANIGYCAFIQGGVTIGEYASIPFYDVVAEDVPLRFPGRVR